MDALFLYVFSLDCDITLDFLKKSIYITGKDRRLVQPPSLPAKKLVHPGLFRPAPLDLYLKACKAIEEKPSCGICVSAARGCTVPEIVSDVQNFSQLVARTATHGPAIHRSMRHAIRAKLKALIPGKDETFMKTFKTACTTELNKLRRDGFIYGNVDSFILESKKLVAQRVMNEILEQKAQSLVDLLEYRRRFPEEKIVLPNDTLKRTLAQSLIDTFEKSKNSAFDLITNLLYWGFKNRDQFVKVVGGFGAVCILALGLYTGANAATGVVAGATVVPEVVLAGTTAATEAVVAGATAAAGAVVAGATGAAGTITSGTEDSFFWKERTFFSFISMILALEIKNINDFLKFLRKNYRKLSDKGERGSNVEGRNDGEEVDKDLNSNIEDIEEDGFGEDGDDGEEEVDEVLNGVIKYIEEDGSEEDEEQIFYDAEETIHHGFSSQLDYRLGYLAGLRDAAERLM